MRGDETGDDVGRRGLVLEAVLDHAPLSSSASITISSRSVVMFANKP